MSKEKTNLPNIWDKANKKDIPENSLWFTPDEPEKLKIFKNGEWQQIDPYKDLEERKVK